MQVLKYVLAFPSLERPKPRKKPREKPGYEVWQVLFWLCRVEIIIEHGQDVQSFINDQHGQIIGQGQVARPVNRSGFHSRRQKHGRAAAWPGGLGTARSHQAR